jgi:hypothetical protein
MPAGVIGFDVTDDVRAVSAGPITLYQRPSRPVDQTISGWRHSKRHSRVSRAPMSIASGSSSHWIWSPSAAAMSSDAMTSGSTSAAIVPASCCCLISDAMSARSFR